MTTEGATAGSLAQESLESRLAGQTSELLRLRRRSDIDAALLDLHTACTRQRTVAGTARQIGAVASALLRADAVVVGVCETLSQEPLLGVAVGGSGVAGIDENDAGALVAALHRSADMAWLRTHNDVRVFEQPDGANSPSIAQLQAVLHGPRILVAPLLGQGEYVGCVVARLASGADVTEQARALQDHAGDLLHLALVIDELRRRALHDAVTGLPNLAVYEQRLVRALGRRAADQPGHAEVCAILVQLDGVGPVTERHGATGAQELLRSVAARLSEMAPEHDLGHLGAAHFALISHGTHGAGIDLSRTVAAYLEEPYPLSLGTVSLQCRVGVATARDGETAAALLRRSEAAARNAAEGGSRIAVS